MTELGNQSLVDCCQIFHSSISGYEEFSSIQKEDYSRIQVFTFDLSSQKKLSVFNAGGLEEGLNVGLHFKSNSRVVAASPQALKLGSFLDT